MSTQLQTSPAVESLRTHGCYRMDSEHQSADGYAELMQAGREFAECEYVQTEAAERLNGKKSGGFKDFLIRPQDAQVVVADSPLLRFAASPLLLDTVQESLGCDVRLQSAELWYVVPWMGRDKQWSHSWHRDPEDVRIVKMFLYISDVDQDSGPFEYVEGSHRDYFNLCQPGRYMDPANYAHLPASACLRNTGPAGSLLMANTSGIHRGGYGTKPRVSVALSYVSELGPARRFEIRGVPEWATAEQRRALAVA
jgi:ectoine hydroxylase-related dioxygenase (phytanoyl-CoA dioxygenase family)